MASSRLRNRSRLRRKEIAQLAHTLQTEWGLADPPFGEETPLDEAEHEGRKIYLLDHEAIALEHEGALAPTVRGLLKWTATRRYVTVDMGAVRFVTNGADTMGPGITEADDAVGEGELVWIREERHGKPLAIGQALVDAAAMRAKQKGKAVRSIHYLGDKVWTLGHEETEARPAASKENP